jgi:hypothetical protein
MSYKNELCCIDHSIKIVKTCFPYVIVFTIYLDDIYVVMINVYVVIFFYFK